MIYFESEAKKREAEEAIVRHARARKYAEKQAAPGLPVFVPLNEKHLENRIICPECAARKAKRAAQVARYRAKRKAE